MAKYLCSLLPWMSSVFVWLSYISNSYIALVVISWFQWTLGYSVFISCTCIELWHFYGPLTSFASIINSLICNHFTPLSYHNTFPAFSWSTALTTSSSVGYWMVISSVIHQTKPVYKAHTSTLRPFPLSPINGLPPSGHLLTTTTIHLYDIYPTWLFFFKCFTLKMKAL